MWGERGAGSSRCLAVCWQLRLAGSTRSVHAAASTGCRGVQWAGSTCGRLLRALAAMRTSAWHAHAPCQTQRPTLTTQSTAPPAPPRTHLFRSYPTRRFLNSMAAAVAASGPPGPPARQGEQHGGGCVPAWKRTGPVSGCRARLAAVQAPLGPGSNSTAGVPFRRSGHTATTARRPTGGLQGTPRGSMNAATHGEHATALLTWCMGWCGCAGRCGRYASSTRRLRGLRLSCPAVPVRERHPLAAERAHAAALCAAARRA